MRILLVAPFFPPHRAVASLRTYSFARTWAAAGHEVTVLTTPKRTDQAGLRLPTAGFRVVEIGYQVPRVLERLRAGERTSRSPADEGGGSRREVVFRPFRWLKARTGVFGGVRQPDLTDFWAGPATRWALTHGAWDAVVSSFGPPAAVRVGLTVKARNRCRVWAVEFRDLWLDNDPYSGLFPFPLLERRTERRALVLADVVVTISPGLAARLRQKSGRPVEVIYNGYDAESFAGLPPDPAFPADGRLRLVHTGAVYPARQDPAPLLAALPAVPSATLVVVGAQGALWRSWAGRFGIPDRLDVRAEVPRPDALWMQRDASALVLFGWGKTPNGVLPGKFFEYLRADAPVWVVGGSARSSVAEMVRRVGRGAHLPDTRAVVAALHDLAAGRAAAGPRDRALLADLERGRQAERFLRLLS